MWTQEIRRTSKFYVHTKCGRLCLLFLLATLCLVYQSSIKSNLIEVEPLVEEEIKVNLVSVVDKPKYYASTTKSSENINNSQSSKSFSSQLSPTSLPNVTKAELKARKRQELIDGARTTGKLLHGEQRKAWQPIFQEAVETIDHVVEGYAPKTMNQMYQVFKSNLLLWNRNSSAWATNTSMTYRVDLDLREDNPWPREEFEKREMFEVEQYLEQCQCSRKVMSTEREGTVDAKFYNRSSCSRQSAVRGHHQRVVGFSFYGDPNSAQSKFRKYFLGIKENLELLKKFYPGWHIRIYYDLGNGDSLLSELCEMACANPDLELCDVNKIPLAGNITKVFAMIWRFFPMLDPQVSHFVSRDLDSRLNAREAAAVAEWLKSDKAFHSMRDNPAHGIELLGAAWGVRMTDLERDYAKAAFRMGSKDTVMFWAPRFAYGPDQGFLKRYIWPWAKWNAMSHDSYSCQTFTRTSPFPVQRKLEKNNFVAAVVSANDILKKECPYKCRPKDHKDWIYC